MRYINALALLLVIVGAANWLLVGIAKFDLVAALTGTSFGQTNVLSSIIYILVGVSGVLLLIIGGLGLAGYRQVNKAQPKPVKAIDNAQQTVTSLKAAVKPQDKDGSAA